MGSLAPVALAFDDARAAALSLPGAEEHPHHEIVSFRVRGRIFATAPDEACLRVMVDEARVLELVAREPDVYRPVPWGRRVAAVAIDLTRAEAAEVRDLLEEAWRRRVPPSWVAPGPGR